MLGVGAVALIGHAADYDRVLEALRRASRPWFALCAAGQVAAYAGYVLGYRALARALGGPVVSFWTAARVTIASFGAFVVGSTAGGIAVDYWAIHRAGAGPHEAAPRVLAVKVLEWAVLGAFAALASLAVLAGAGAGAPFAMTLGWLAVVPASAAAAVYLTQPERAERLASLDVGEAPGARGLDVAAWARWVAVTARTVFSDAIGAIVLVRGLLARPRGYRDGVAGYPLYWAGDLLTLYAALRAFGVDLDAPSLVLAYATGYVVATLPLPAGGAGTAEAALAFTLTAVGVELAPAVLAAFAYRFFTFWLPIAPALLVLPSVRRLNDELPRAEREDVGGPKVVED